jgi:hypothetical protein
MKFVVQFINLLFGLFKSLLAGRGDFVDPAAVPSHILEDGLQEPAAFQAVEERIESSRSDAIPVMGQLLHHCESKDGFVGRMDEHMDPYQAEKEFPLVISHRLNIPPVNQNRSSIVYYRNPIVHPASQSPGRPEASMQYCSRCLKLVLFSLVVLTAGRLWAQGPPYQTDDPVPVDLHHYEFYIFGGVDGTPAEIDSTGPALEFNWGAVPRVQLHAILPWGGVFPSNNPVYLPGGTGPSAFGLTDMELGVKLAIIKEGKHIPQIGTFTMFEMPSGSYDKGLGVGKVWYKLPVWLQKNYGKWLFDGGGGYEVVPQANYRDFPYTGWLVKRQLNERLELGAELFAHGREGFATAQTERSAMIDVGGYYHFKHNPNKQFLFCYGHSVAGQTETYAYVGMYWTWGGQDDKGKDDDKKDTDRNNWMQGPMRGNGFE